MPKSTPVASMRRAPLACFDTMKHIDDCVAPDYLTPVEARDFDMTRSFLQAYTGSQDTFNAYRRDIERLLHWSWHIAGKTLQQLKRQDIEQFLQFCQKPPIAWIALSKTTRFKVVNGQRQPNPM